MRPSDEKFMDNTNFKIGKLKHIQQSKDYFGGGGTWLGSEFFKSIGNKPFPV